ncbi:MAG TPA: nucleoside hydrolase [Limnochordia bacterium]|nr:nucleoside hydrolase [Limnochordia bacterium]
MKTKIILDVDPGHDDAVAILVAAKHEKLDLRGITVVAGNQVLEKTLQNALKVCSFAGIDVPVYAGQDRPLLRDQVIADDIHGDSGLDGPQFPPPTKRAEEKSAVDFIIEECLQHDREIVLVPTGPLTNIALALLKEPRIKQGIKEIVLMGGAYGLGNVTPSAEFNIFVDPEAAHIVFESGLPITMVGLDLTHQAKAYPEVVERIRRLGTPVAELVVELFAFFGDTYKRVFGFEAPPLHDVCAVAHVIDPTLIKTQKVPVVVETTRGACYGRTVCDFYFKTGKPANVHVAMELDQKRFWDLVIDTLSKY